MNIFTHIAGASNELRTAKRMQFGGLIAVAASLLIFYALPYPIGVYASYPFLLTGFPVWLIGRARIRRLGNSPAADQKVNAELKGLSDKYTLHHNATIEGRVVDHLLITPNGAIVMDDNPAVGHVSCTSGAKGDRWSTRTSMLDKISGAKPAIGDPSADVGASLNAVRAFLDKNGKTDVPARALIVFTANPDIEIEESTYPAVPLNELKPAVRELQDDMGGDREGARTSTMLTSDDRRRLNTALGTPAPARAAAKPASARS